jgi:hypothetical protein
MCMPVSVERRRGKSGIAIMHKIAGRLVVGEGVPELLSDPRCRRVGGDRGVDDASTVMPQDHQHEEEPERDCGHDEQVGGHDLAGVIREERPPGLRRWARMPTQVFRDGRLTDGNAELLQFAVDSRRTPERIRS